MMSKINKLSLFLLGMTFTAPALAVGSIITAYLFNTAATAFAWYMTATAFAINLVVSSVISKALYKAPDMGAGSSPNPGNRQQVPPATDNKLPVVYGSAWVGGTIIDLSISSNNQKMYYVMALSEVTGSSDTITFGQVYYGGKLVTFQGDGYTVASLTDESTGEVNTQVAGKIAIYLYSNGSNSPANSSISAISVMTDPDLVYQWDSTKLMSNCAFAIVKLEYNQDARITGIEQTKFQITNSRYKPGDCFLDYLTNTRYGAAIPLIQVDTTSLTALNTYCDQTFTYTPYAGGTATQTRFRFDGVLDVNRTIMQNLQDMAACCDCQLKYNEITAKWGVIVQSPAYTVAMAIDDSSIVSAIQITPIDISSTFNVIEVKFPDKSNQDAFNSVTYDLAQIDPSLLFPNEPVNKQSLSLPLVNDNVRSQYLANRFLKNAREDLQVDCSVNFVGIQLEAGDIVTLTNVNYGFVAKLFRITKVTETFNDDGSVIAKLLLQEYNPSIYDDVSITEFSPSPNTGIGNPLYFGTLTPPVVTSQYPTASVPSFGVSVTTASSGITQYAEVWYSAFSSPASDQMIFAGTSEVQANGTPWNVSTALPIITLSGIPAGNWYLFTRMVNSLGTSNFSNASSLLQWRPTTFQYSDRYLNVAYANDISGGGFSLNPRNKLYYGLMNSSVISASTNPTDYKWYFAEPSFGTNKYLVFCNRQNRKFSFDTDFATYAAGTAAFVPATTSQFDPTIWGALLDGINHIDLDARTGQLISTGTTSVGTGEIAISNNNQGQVIAQLAQYLDFGGPYQMTASAATITVDIYGRVVGFEAPDSFYFTKQIFVATSGQTVFSVTRGAGYIVDQCWVLQNGLILNEDEYIDAAATVTLATGATLDDVITVVSFKSENPSSGVYASFTRHDVSLSNASSYTASGFTIESGYELLFLNGTVVNESDYDIVDQTITNFPDLVTGNLTILQWSQNNLTVPNGNPVNILAYTQAGVPSYPFAYNANAFNLYENGVMLKQTNDYSTATGTYTLTPTPSGSNIMLQQTFSRTGAV